MRMRKHGRVDNIQREVVLELRRAGATVLVLSHLGSGAPDILAGYGGSNFLLELKSRYSDSSKARLTPDEREFLESWRGSAHVVFGVDEALRVVGISPEME